MNNGRDKDYNFGNKKQFRRTVWNQIKNRLDVPVKDAVVLYMGGKKDLDRAVAVKKGFKPENLIFMDDDKKIIMKHRNRGVVAILGDAVQVFGCLLNTKKINAVYFDFCGGLTEKRMEILNVLLSFCGYEGVVACNFLRARDNFPAKYRETFDAEPEHKHRGKIFAATLGFYGSVSFLKNNGLEVSKIKYSDVARVGCEIFRCQNPFFYSYKSKKGKATQVFDSVVIRNIPVDSSCEPPKITNHLKAMLAVRTMRLNRKLSPSPCE